jgi:hypothetical protein
LQAKISLPIFWKKFGFAQKTLFATYERARTAKEKKKKEETESSQYGNGTGFWSFILFSL